MSLWIKYIVLTILNMKTPDLKSESTENLTGLFIGVKLVDVSHTHCMRDIYNFAPKRRDIILIHTCDNISLYTKSEV